MPGSAGRSLRRRSAQTLTQFGLARPIAAQGEAVESTHDETNATGTFGMAGAITLSGPTGGSAALVISEIRARDASPSTVREVQPQARVRSMRSPQKSCHAASRAFRQMTDQPPECFFPRRGSRRPRRPFRWSGPAGTTLGRDQSLVFSRMLIELACQCCRPTFFQNLKFEFPRKSRLRTDERLDRAPFIYPLLRELRSIQQSLAYMQSVKGGTP